ncbi:hypothetical protein V1525DRAFT_398696 [Lipomyces kononenkoae]|uniref:Uncharacterized protein n=1 Tax=Lipomyces kononenkoae TaxID=34357 RepID=A0ACC3T6K0_LIPKO
MPERPNINREDVPNQKGKGRAASQASSRSQSVLANATATVLRSFASPSAVTSSLSSATASASQQKTSPSTPSGANLHYSDELSGTINASSSISPGSFGEVPFEQNSFRAEHTSSSDTQRQYEEFVESSASQPTANVSSKVCEPQMPPSIHSDENDGSVVIDFLSASQGTEAVYSTRPPRYRAPEPKYSQIGYSQILSDIAVIEDPVEYLLTTCNYSEDVWGTEWAELQRAKQELIAGNKSTAQRRIHGIIGRLRSRL